MSSIKREERSICIDGESVRYTLQRSTRRKRTVQLQAHPDEGIKLLAPASMRQSELEAFVRSKREWMLKRWKGLEAAKHRRDWDSGETILFRGALIPVVIGEPYQQSARRAPLVTVIRTLDSNELQIRISTGIDEAERYDAIGQALMGWYRQEALDYLLERIKTWGQITGLHPARVRIRSPRQRWASCSVNRSINLNWRLITLPDELSDYVLLHELVHLRELNHSSSFWNLLSAIMPDCKERRKALRKYSSSSEL